MDKQNTIFLGKAWEKFSHLFKRQEIPARTILLREGQVSKTGYYIEKGCMRSWFNNDSKDITFQFFLKVKAYLQLKVSEPISPACLPLRALNLALYTAFQKKIFNLLLIILPPLKMKLKNRYFAA